ncbi:SAV_6107 family HEPN domain-containing protein [Rhodococcus sp. HNM0569]|uniref:SAV_6107 family HEPN domain-containing protein n=1 Tax=Rhodococcus sp. HNM0569 TaxID=2716340 RepID=UPI00146AE595|nr:SAV_6107 family HEPN domain-containing protein [Rhodococcus sp. HNM0569]NLU82910.1 hypothetical protein [Rhodococcus sp. HNM0569]
MKYVPQLPGDPRVPGEPDVRSSLEFPPPPSPLAPPRSSGAPESALRAPGSPQASLLLSRADALLARSAAAESASDIFLEAYLAALRGAGAVGALASATRSRSRNAWVLLASADPAFTAWAEYFAGHSSTRAALESGAARTVTYAHADEFHGQVARFLGAVRLRVDNARAVERYAC